MNRLKLTVILGALAVFGAMIGRACARPELSRPSP